jgi:hypothetical protein
LSAETASGDGPGVDHEEAEPAHQEARNRVKGLAQVDVVPPGAREHRPQLGVGQGACEREQTARDPDREDDPGMGEQIGDPARRQEDPRANHTGHDQQRRVAEMKLATQAVAGMGVGLGLRHRAAR